MKQKEEKSNIYIYIYIYPFFLILKSLNGLNLENSLEKTYHSSLTEIFINHPQ